MTDVLEEVTSGASRDGVVARVIDWEQRIRELYETVASWLPPGWTAQVRDKAVSMNETMMRDAGIPARRLPALALLRAGLEAASIVPQTLWIVGANGRLVLQGEGRIAFIVDRAQSFEPADWRLVMSDDRSRSTKLNRSSLAVALG